MGAFKQMPYEAITKEQYEEVCCVHCSRSVSHGCDLFGTGGRKKSHALFFSHLFQAIRKVKEDVSLSSANAIAETVEENQQTFCDNDRCIKL